MLNPFCFCICFLLLLGSVEAASQPSYVNPKVWAQVSPYLLPDDHPVKPILDTIFSTSRATLGLKTMKKAGFEKAYPQQWTHVIVTRHPDVPGYVFKIYLDAQRYFRDKPEYVQWLERVQGAELIRETIALWGWGDKFKVPRKWIYLLPEYPAPPKEFLRKNFILVEEDMQIYSQKDNYKIWKSDAITEELLTKLHALLEEVGLRGGTKADNVPFAFDGRIAFIDTQSCRNWPIDYSKFTPYLSPTRQKIWKNIIK